jgi:ribonuclease D
MSQIVVVDSPELLQSAVESLRDQEVVGFDSEWIPYSTYGPQVLQLATMDKAFLFRMNYLCMGKPVDPIELEKGTHEHYWHRSNLNFDQLVINEVKELLQLRKLIKVGIGLEQDLSLLKTNFEIVVASGMDLNYFLTRFSKRRSYFKWLSKMTCSDGPVHHSSPEAYRSLPFPRKLGLQKAVGFYLQQHLVKPGDVSISNWSKPLDVRQIMYAAQDAHAVLAVYHAWKKRTRYNNKNNTKGNIANEVIERKDSP